MPPTGTRAPSSRNLKREQWEDTLTEIVEHKEACGHWPTKNENYRLHLWIGRQRTYFNKGTLSQVRLNRLNQINFPWKTRYSRKGSQKEIPQGSPEDESQQTTTPTVVPGSPTPASEPVQRKQTSPKQVSPKRTSPKHSLERKNPQEVFTGKLRRSTRARNPPARHNYIDPPSDEDQKNASDEKEPTPSSDEAPVLVATRAMKTTRSRPATTNTLKSVQFSKNRCKNEEATKSNTQIKGNGDNDTSATVMDVSIDDEESSQSTVIVIPPLSKDNWWNANNGQKNGRGAHDLVKRCIVNYSWSREKALSVLETYSQYWKARVQLEDWNDTQLKAPGDVDMMWREHYLDVENYKLDCVLLCGGNFLWRNTRACLEDKGKSERRRIATRAAVVGIFGKQSVNTAMWEFPNAPDGVARAPSRDPMTHRGEENVCVYVLDTETNEQLRFRLDVNTRFSKVLRKLAKKKGVKDIHLVWERRRLRPDDTPGKLGMGDGASILAMFVGSSLKVG